MSFNPRTAAQRAAPEVRAAPGGATAVAEPVAPPLAEALYALDPPELIDDVRVERSLPPAGEPPAWPRLRTMADVAALATASAVALSAGWLPAAMPWLTAVFVVTVLAMLHRRHGPERRLHQSLIGAAAGVLGATGRAALGTLAVCALAGAPHAGAFVARLGLVATACLALPRLALIVARRRAGRARSWSAPTIIVGAGVVGDYLARRLLDEPSYGLRPVGYVDADPTLTRARVRTRLPVLGELDALGDAIEQTRTRRVIVAFSSEPDHALVRTVRECEQRGVEVSVVPRLYESINEYSALDHVGGLPLLTLRPTNPRSWQFAVKHAIDRSVATVALPLLAPLLGAIALMVRLSSPGPILFRQPRIGRDGREFTLLKFRTMAEARHTADPFALAPGIAPGGVEGEDRRTAIGRFLRTFSLDELPQLVNVLRGEMSLVGPRPERPEFVRRFAAEIARYHDRHRVKSGITGWAQVNGLRGQTSILERVECDNYYVQNWSLRLDMQILLLTIVELLRRRG